jgi:hypothetical protein
MSTHKNSDPKNRARAIVDASKGYEASDVHVSGIVVFIASMAVFVVVVALAAYGIGKALNWHIAKEDGTKNKWAAPVDVRPLGNLPTNPELESKLGGFTQRFPAPRLQNDDGLQDLADLHAREDLLLDHYSWANRAQGKVRIPIDRAMELVAARGLPAAPAVERAPLLTGDSEPEVAAPLTNGFVRTGYEQEQAIAAGRAEPHK